MENNSYIPSVCTLEIQKQTFHRSKMKHKNGGRLANRVLVRKSWNETGEGASLYSKGAEQGTL